MLEKKKSEQAVLKQRKDLKKKLAPHFIGEVSVPVAWLKPSLPGYANRDYYELLIFRHWGIVSILHISEVIQPQQLS